MRYRFQMRDQVYEITIDREGDTYQATVDGQSYPCEVLDSQPGQVSMRFDGKPVTVYWATDGGEKWLSINGCTYRLQKPMPRSSGHGAARRDGEASAGETVRAPMPAQVRAVQVSEGDLVEKGQTLLLLEAMKMEIRIKAPVGGRIEKLLVEAGQTVEKDQPLAEVQPDSEGNP